MFTVNRYTPGEAIQSEQRPHHIRLRTAATNPIVTDSQIQAAIQHDAELKKDRVKKERKEKKKKKDKDESKSKKSDRKDDDDDRKDIICDEIAEHSKSKKKSSKKKEKKSKSDDMEIEMITAEVVDDSNPKTISDDDVMMVDADLRKTSTKRLRPDHCTEVAETSADPEPAPKSSWFHSDRVIVIPEADHEASSETVLAPALLACLRDHFRIERLFPMQTFLISAIQRDRRLRIDSCISSPTGSGKTLCFALPIVANLASRVVRRLRALILVPTRDLAIQLREVIGKLADCVGLRTGLAIGQRSFEFEQSEIMSGSGVDILIATPGRLTDHLQFTPSFTLQYLEYLVLDEADRLFGQNFQSWELSFQRARASSSTTLQTLLFSATMSLNPLSLAKLELRAPVFYCRTIENEFACAASLKQQMLVCPELTDKIPYLVWVLRQHRCKKIIFTNALEASHNLKRTFEIFGEFEVDEFHSGLRQKQRMRILQTFKSSQDHTLICSDVMARGIDIEGIELVVNYDCPNFLRTYLHRVGRTARANRDGVAVTLVLPHEVRHFRAQLRHAENNHLEKLSIPREEKQSLRQELEPCIETAQLLFDAEQRNRFDRSQPVRSDPKQSIEEVRERIQKSIR